MTKRKDGRVQNQKKSHKKYGILKELCENKSVNIFFAGTVHAEDDTTATLLGMRTRAYKFQPVADIKNITNFELRTPSEPQWWMKLRSIMAILAQHDSTYEVEGLDPAANTDGETLDH